MRRRWTLALAFGLLLAAGVAFAVLGLRALRLERDEDERNARRRAEATLGTAEPLAVQELLAPHWDATESWNLGFPRSLHVRVVEPETAARRPLLESHEESFLDGVAPEDRLLFEEATFLEARRGDLQGSRKILERLAQGPREAALSAAAALRAGALALRLNDRISALALLEAAAEAPPDLLVDDVSARTAALYHLAILDATSPNVAVRVARLLDVADDGRSIRGDGGMDAADLVIAAAEALSPPAPASSSLPGPVASRLTEAADRARRGHAVLAALGEARVTVAFGHLVSRPPNAIIGQDVLELHDMAQFSIPGEGAGQFGRLVGATTGAALVPEGAAVVRLNPPLDGVLLYARRDPAGTTGGQAVLALVAGLLVYVLGAAVAILAVRRSARTAEMQADFVAAVSHEMKTPIAAVQAMSEMLADGHVQDPERAKAYAERIRIDMQRLGATVRNVLDAARIERGGATLVDPRPGDPAGVVEHVAEAVRPILEGRGFRFDVDSRPALRPVPMDSDALTSVLGNLLDNAAKFSGESREVTLRAGPRPGGFRIEVLDRGPGVPARDKARVFERFYRGEAAKRGAVPGIGLGLHVARELVQAHGGSLHVEDREGGGAAFVVDLPGSAA